METYPREPEKEIRERIEYWLGVLADAQRAVEVANTQLNMLATGFHRMEQLPFDEEVTHNID